MNWQNYIHADPNILLGKPVIRGTRLSVDFILSLLATGWDNQAILREYPTLSPDALQAVFAFVAECLREETFYNKVAA